MRIVFAGHAKNHSTMGHRLSPWRACARAAGDVLLQGPIFAFQGQPI
jgi:hypothetical protein